MKVGILTGGGDCPGLNAVIRALVRRGTQEYGYEFTGFRDGWRGPLEGDTIPLDSSCRLASCASWSAGSKIGYSGSPRSRPSCVTSASVR